LIVLASRAPVLFPELLGVGLGVALVLVLLAGGFATELGVALVLLAGGLTVELGAILVLLAGGLAVELGIVVLLAGGFAVELGVVLVVVLLAGGFAGVVTSVPSLTAFCKAPSLVDANGQPFPEPFRFWIVIEAAVILADLSCFESPVGNETLTEGLLTANPA